jgi:hypothetical protein
MSFSAALRDAMPAAEMIFCNRTSIIGFYRHPKTKPATLWGPTDLR